MRSAIFLALCGLSATFAVPLEKKADYAIKDSHFIPSQWKKLAKAHPSHTISLRIGVKQGNFKELERQLLEVSDPEHHLYGKHLSQDDVTSLVAPSQQALGLVHDWLEDNNIRLDQVRYTPAKDWVIVNLPVTEVENLLDTEYHVYENDAGSRIVRTPEYSLPKWLHEHVDTIQPTNYFSDPKAMAKLPFGLEDQGLTFQEATVSADSTNLKTYGGNDAAAVCNTSAVSSLCLRTLYRTVDYTPEVPHLNYVGTTNYLNETANYSDFHIYMSQQRKDADSKYQYSYQIVDNGINFQGLETEFYGERDVEANLDVQTVGGIAYPTRFTTYSTGGSPPFTPDLATPTNTNEPYLTWVNYVLSQPSVPFTISTSYGDDEQSVPKSYAQRVCAEFAALGARGSTLLFSSGDNGVGKNGTCLSNDGKNTPKFQPSFPASCPYVTTVGGTKNINPEEVAYRVRNGYVAGGGVSNYFPRPLYQKSAVKKYLASIGNLHKGLYNPNGRAYPDISAQGYGFVVVYGGKNTLVDGTSASSPAAAGILTNVNDALIAAGRPPLGFMNPWLYSRAGKGFNDITVGNIWGCNTSGFPAKDGWDLATGYGTPDFKNIRAALGV
ncbi:tripeptidyl peptidase-like protein [Zymoseptoria brevis]|uniref:tripeptidyl-peptidase II n=1 Tax=Zymoseptoria brevis TaxID=1047168 RepID=A0A0F4GY72_9PEZI|nr:tripeptidyl peptidase-like protein [Zymoseptoria brevis]